MLYNIKYSVHFLLAGTILLAGCEKKYAEDERKVSINEIMPYNKSAVADPAGEYDDWIELCNLSSDEQDISGWYLSDSKSDRTKYRFPASTRIEPGGYIIIWCDNDSTQAGLHAGFKLSTDGEKVILSYRDGKTVDKVEYPAFSLEMSYSRFPDGTGDFRWQLYTFLMSNNSSN
jgi:hypothetical protein